jgi:hypothetical protein
MAYLPIIGGDGNGWFIEDATGDVVLLLNNAVKHRITKAGGVTSGGTITAEDLTATDDLAVGDDASISGALGVTGLATLSAGGTLGPGTAGIVKTSAPVSITAAELKALAATPKTILAAVASKMLCPIGFHCMFDYGSEVLAEPSAPDDPQFKYVDGSGVACSATFDAGELLVKAADQYAWIPAIQVEGGTLAELVNVPIVLHNTGGEYTGNASNDSVLEVTAVYYELDVS